MPQQEGSADADQHAEHEVAERGLVGGATGDGTDQRTVADDETDDESETDQSGLLLAGAPAVDELDPAAAVSHSSGSPWSLHWYQP